MRKTIISLLLVAGIITVSVARKPKNVILMIGDGMGIAQIYSGMVANNNNLTLEEFPVSGFSKTYSSNNFVTDSGAGGSAISTGKKTKNGMIGMTLDSVAVETVLEQAERNGLATAIVVSCAVTHATPAGFIAHQVNRNMYEEIAADFLNTDVDVVIGGGLKFFTERQDGRDLTAELKAKAYQIVTDSVQMLKVKEGKLYALMYEEHPAAMPSRGDILSVSTKKAIDLISKNKKGFFMMVEGSQIDWACHANNEAWSSLEVIDFDKAVKAAFDFAKKDGNTLIVVTADHETGGLTLTQGNLAQGVVESSFSTGNHSGVPVPVFAYGPGAQEFSGFMENTEFKSKIAKLLKLK